jgi:tetratricopeptide (TPR) repeat protein
MPIPLLPRGLAAIATIVLLGASLATAQGGTPRLAQSERAAAERAQRLDAQFARLESAASQEDGDAAVAEIWKLWLQSGKPELDELMDQAARLLGAGLTPLAIPILDDLTARAPDWAEAWNKRATALYLAGEHERSLADIERVLALEPRHFGALAGIGLIRIARGEFREALAAYRKALAINPFLRERLELIPALQKKVGESPT